MRLNWDTVLVGKRVVLVPYRERYVAPYHAWMQDDALLEQTASERLTLAEERANQASWRRRREEADLHRPPGACFGRRPVPAAAMAGDCNLFLDRDGAPEAEVEVMVAERKFRRRCFGRRGRGAPPAPRCVAELGRPRRFFAKIGDANGPSRRLFEGTLGFEKCNYRRRRRGGTRDTNAHHDFAAAAEPGDFAADEALEREIDAVDEAFDAVDVADAADAGGPGRAGLALTAARVRGRGACRSATRCAAARARRLRARRRRAERRARRRRRAGGRRRPRRGPRADGARCAPPLAWLRGLEAAGKADHPDAAPANGIAGDALRALAATRAAPVVARVAGAAWATAAEVHAALAKLDAAADRLKRLYDARRWIADECARRHKGT
ncbi:N-acetyltransferase [Aureococcus anophagefferens]|uniref:N-acetyltransferase n=1 Tax=Aureococcus anophagefferens TaxID=44056 RepID=A0ABR1FYX7_AURAN